MKNLISHNPSTDYDNNWHPDYVLVNIEQHWLVDPVAIG